LRFIYKGFREFDCPLNEIFDIYSVFPILPC
jgi:hypothetical protein